eukprot:g9113.t1
MHLEVLRTPSVPSDAWASVECSEPASAAMAARLFEELSHQQVQAHVTRFNRMMQLVDPSCWRLTVNMLEVMSTWGLQPDVYSHSIATRAARNAGGHRGWLLSLAFLSSTSTAAVNSSLSAFARFHKWEWSINGAQGAEGSAGRPQPMLVNPVEILTPSQTLRPCMSSPKTVISCPSLSSRALGCFDLVPSG